MDPEHSADMFEHLEKQNEVLMDAYRAMSHELHSLQVEEEMLMHKLYELMSAEGLITKKKEGNDSNNIISEMRPENIGEHHDTILTRGLP